MIFLKYYHDYKDFRSRYSILGHFDNFNFDEFETPMVYFSLFEFVGAISFANAIEYIINSKAVDKFEINRIIRNDLVKLIPLINELIPYPQKELSTEQKINVFTKIIIEYRLIIIREASRQFGFLLGKFGLGNPIDDNNENGLFKSYFDEILEPIMETTNDKLKLLPK